MHNVQNSCKSLKNWCKLLKMIQICSKLMQKFPNWRRYSRNKQNFNKNTKIQFLEYFFNKIPQKSNKRKKPTQNHQQTSKIQKSGNLKFKTFTLGSQQVWSQLKIQKRESIVTYQKVEVIVWQNKAFAVKLVSIKMKREAIKSR